MLSRRRIFAGLLVASLFAFAGCGGDGHGGHASSGHGGPDSGHDDHGSDHGDHGSHGDSHGDSHGGGHATAEPADHGPTDEELETSVSFIARPRQLAEVDLGEVFVALHGPDETTYLFESKIYALVDEGHMAEFNEALTARREAMREQLRATIAKSDMKDLFEPKLAGLKITLAAVARKTLRSPHLYDILFSELSIEQD